MKYITLVAVLMSAINFSYGQGLINDIMNVETVNLDLVEVHEKLITKYKLTLEKEKASMDSDIASLDKKYKEEVKKHVDDFTQKLNDGEEKVVATVKKLTVSRVNSLTMTHRTEKKNIVQNFLNKMQVANRSLPKFLREDAAAEVESISAVHLETLTSDYAAHLETIKAFEKQRHLVVTEGAYEPLD